MHDLRRFVHWWFEEGGRVRESEKELVCRGKTTAAAPACAARSGIRSFLSLSLSLYNWREYTHETDERESVKRERKLKRRLFIPWSHSQLRYHTSLNDHSRTATEPATPPVVGNSYHLVPGLGKTRPRSIALGYIRDISCLSRSIDRLRSPGMAAHRRGWVGQRSDVRLCPGDPMYRATPCCPIHATAAMTT